ncbi:type III-B CRISPR module RAMP protein Cmr4 [Crassaminicella indica]|uniref:Type III-B CRISPR module RAMP protein Cmr4 n=1 Tax=Crassaminicella indica TaxID=2855394 RepID=A0ABX8R991_9CLOT|nr:type III-B CRISPR module RAMP protein Cmr4 [Crassaminicella indica]QXM05371.1 type III-B CRISPR module RAMP protein Cmr4 [Crassaminicella indica]
MYKTKEIIYIKAITPIHAGCGQNIGIVDMPIQRERHSNIPKIEASSLKGSIKYSLYKKIEKKKEAEEKKKELYTIFGSEDEADYASAIGFTDAKLLFFPIKSTTDIFKLITCPYIIKRWIEDLEFENEETKNEFNMKLDDGEFISNSNEEKIVLEEYIFEKKKRLEEKSNIFDIFKNIGIDVSRVTIISDSDFEDLVTMYTEVITRNRINIKTGTTKDSALFTEEYLPAETILYFMVLGSPSFKNEDVKTADNVLEYFKKNVDKVFQVGGNATIGKGFVKMLGK